MGSYKQSHKPRKSYLPINSYTIFIGIKFVHMFPVIDDVYEICSSTDNLCRVRQSFEPMNSMYKSKKSCPSYMRTKFLKNE